MLDLYDDYQLQEGQAFVKNIPRPPFTEEVWKPEFKENILGGTEGVWTILCWLIVESQVMFCREILNAKSLYISAGNLTTAVFEYCAERVIFRELFELYSKSAMADHLAGGHERNRSWDYRATGIANSPFVRQLFRWIRTYVSLLNQVLTFVADHLI